MIGQVVSHYRILDELGQGGMGAVYLGEDVHLGRRVAIKFPLTKTNDHQQRARFLREARAASQLNHPNIAAIYDYGETADGRPFIVMELITGQTLSTLINEARLPVARAVEIIKDVARALAEAHANGVIHRDIKPSNVIINERKVIKVLDFGLAKHLNAETLQDADSDARTLLAAKTESGVIVGTPLYLSPEQATGGPVDARSDLFALGAVLYESIAGRPPFSGKGVLEIAAEVIHVAPKPPSTLNPNVPPELDRISLKALAKRPEDRFQSAAEFISDLESTVTPLLEGTAQTPTQRIPLTPTGAASTLSKLSDILRRPRFSFRLIIIAVVLIGALIWGLTFMWRPTPHQPSAEAQRWYQLGTNALREGTYFKARQALQQATAADNNFALAHARLAEAWTELDYGDNAKDETILAGSLVPDRSSLSPLDALYLQAITDTISRNFPNAIKGYSEIVKLVPDTDKAYAYFDLGRAYEKNEDLENAISNYEKATQLDPQFAAAFLRLGILYWRKQEVARAETAFQRAAELYRVSSNFEGVAEVLFQHGVVYDNADKVAEARAKLEESLQIARATNNQYQQIRSELQLSSVLRTAGETAAAQQHANTAIELAQTNGLENLTTSGLIDLGNLYFLKSDYQEAEKHFKQALDYAQRNKGRRNEARAQLSLGSLKMTQNEVSEAVPYLEKALRFYQDGGYRQQTAQALLLFGRANRQKGDYDAALRAFQQQLTNAEQENNLQRQALAHEGLGTVLVRRERYVEALTHFENSYSLFSKTDNQVAIANSMINRAGMLLALGRPQEAHGILAEAAEKAAKIENKQLQVSIDLELASAGLDQRNFSEAKAKSNSALNLAIASQLRGSIIEGKRLLGLAMALSNQKRDGVKLCKEAFELAEQLKDPWVLSETRLTLAGALLENGDTEDALTNALAVQETFKQTLQQDSEWQAFLIAARALQQKGDAAKAREYAKRSADLLAGLEQTWGKDPYSKYLSRPDVAYGRQQLEQLLN